MKKIATGVLAFLIAIGLGIRIWYVNTYTDPVFTPPKTEIYQMNEWVELDGTFQYSADENTRGYAVKLENVEFMTPEEYAKRYNMDITMFQIGANGEMPEAVADLTLNFRNKDCEDGFIQFIYYRLYSEKDLRSFFPLADVNAALHPEMSGKLGFMVYPGTETGSNHFCLVSGVEMSGTVTGNYKYFPKYLQLTMTPTRKVIEITNIDE